MKRMGVRDSILTLPGKKALLATLAWNSQLRDRYTEKGQMGDLAFRREWLGDAFMMNGYEDGVSDCLVSEGGKEDQKRRNGE